MKNKLGVYYAFLATSDTVDWLDCLRRAHMAGLNILEVSAPKLRPLSDAARREIADHAKALGLGLTFATALTPATDVGDFSPAVRTAGIKLLIDDLKMVHSMGGQALSGMLTGVGKHFPKGIEHTRWSAMERAASSLREVAGAAEDMDIDMGIEVVNRFESPLVNTCAEGLKIASFVNSPRVGVHLDTFHMNIEEADMGDTIRTAGKHLIHFHACENNRALPGQGHIDWIEVLTALSVIGYGGPIVMEALPGPYGSLPERLNIFRQLSADVDGDLYESTRYLRKRMREVV